MAAVAVAARVAPGAGLALAGPRRGVAFFLLSQLCLVLDGAAVHHLGTSVAVPQLTLLRALGSLVLLGALLAAAGQGPSVFRTARPGMQALRGALTVVPLWLIFWGLARMPLADATAIGFTLPVWMALLGAALLRERVPPRRWLAVALGFAGALAVAGPGFAAWDVAYLAALLGVALNAGGSVAARALGRGDSALTTFAWIAAVGLVLSLPGALAAPPLPAGEWPALLLLAAAGTGAVWFGLLAVRSCDVSALAPYGCARLPIALALGFLLFGEVPGPAALAGAALILAAGALPLLSRRPSGSPRSPAAGRGG